MKKSIAVLSIVFLLVAAVCFAADYKKDIVGSWTYAFKGADSKIDHNADGTFVLVTRNITVKGTYAVDGNKLTLTTPEGKKIGYTIQAYDGKKMTIKRDADGREIVYNKK
jgi:uncharacterized protein (TIGR03066 family)